MNQYKQLVKRTARIGITSLIVVGVCGGIYGGVYIASDSVAAEKTASEKKLSEETSRLNSLRSQMDKSGQAEQKFGQIMAARTNPEFGMNQESLYEWLKNATIQFRLNSLKMTRAPETETNKPELLRLNHLISVRRPVKIEFSAISDMHVFSFIDALERTAPGLVTIENVQLRRKNDLKPEMLTGIRNGVTPLLVEAKIEFSWIGVAPKAEPVAGAAKAPGAPTPPGGGE